MNEGEVTGAIGGGVLSLVGLIAIVCGLSERFPPARELTDIPALPPWVLLLSTLLAIVGTYFVGKVLGAARYRLKLIHDRSLYLHEEE